MAFVFTFFALTAGAAGSAAVGTAATGAVTDKMQNGGYDPSHNQAQQDPAQNIHFNLLQQHEGGVEEECHQPGHSALGDHHDQGPFSAQLPFHGGDGRHTGRIQQREHQEGGGRARRKQGAQGCRGAAQ